MEKTLAYIKLKKDIDTVTITSKGSISDLLVTITKIIQSISKNTNKPVEFYLNLIKTASTIENVDDD